MYNSHIQDAYQLALMAVQKNPLPLNWHERLAQTAMWTGNYGLGFKQWLYILKKHKTAELINYLLRVSKVIRFDEVYVIALQYHIADNPGDVDAYFELAKEK